MTAFSTRRAALTTLAAAISLSAWAQPASTGPIVIGISRPYTGALKGVAAGYVEAFKAAMDAVNAQGGINGSKIELVEKDDEGVPANTEKQVRALADDARVVALVGVAGTGNVLAAYPVLEAAKLPLIGPFSGAVALRDMATRKMIFHVRASYDDELDGIAKNMAERAPTGKVVVLYQDDAFGAGALASFNKQVAAKGPKLTVSAIKFDRTSGVLAEPTLAQVALRQSNAVLLIGAPKAIGMLLKTVRTESQTTHAYTLSVVDALALVKDVGAPVAKGLLITQVMPNPRKGAMKLVRDYRALMESTNQPLSYAGLEGYLTARVLFEALGRVKGAASRDKLMTALEDGGRLDVAGFPISFSRKSHEGSRFVDMSLVSASGSIID